MSVEETIDFSTSYTSRFRLRRIDPGGWEPVSELIDVRDIQIDRDCTDQIPLLETGSMTIDVTPRDEFESGWYRLYNQVSQGRSASVDIPIATLWLEGLSGSIDYGIDSVDVNGYSVLKPLEDRKVQIGEYVPKNYPVEMFLERIVSESTPAPVIIDGSFSLNDYYVLEPNQTYLEVMWMLLDAAKWCAQIDGAGVVHIGPRPKHPFMILDQSVTDIIMPGINYNSDRSEIPNRYTAIQGTKTAVVVNNDENSSISYRKRGWYKDVVDVSPTLVNGESLEMYAKRQLEAASTVTKTWSYTREWIPGLYPFHLLDAQLPDQKLTGEVRVLAQSIKAEKGLVVTEKIGLDIKEYKS